MGDRSRKWDVFISHTSEDKDSFVRSLATALRSLGISVWYDEFSLHPGDSLSRSIDKGLADSTFGLVVISPHFIDKPWPEYELRGLVAREISEGRVILPIWHGVTKEEVLSFSPPLADKVALDTTGLTAQDIAIGLLREIRPDLYAKHTRTQLEGLASGAAIQELQAQLEAAHEQLAEYRCPHCSSPIAFLTDAPADERQKHWDVRETFECGLQRFGGVVERPCPSDPEFPSLEDYDLKFQRTAEGRGLQWACFPRGTTDMSRRLHLSPGLGETKEQALESLQGHYGRISAKWTR